MLNHAKPSHDGEKAPEEGQIDHLAEVGRVVLEGQLVQPIGDDEATEGHGDVAEGDGEASVPGPTDEPAEDEEESAHSDREQAKEALIQGELNETQDSDEESNSKGDGSFHAHETPVPAAFVPGVRAFPW